MLQDKQYLCSYSSHNHPEKDDHPINKVIIVFS